MLKDGISSNEINYIFSNRKNKIDYLKAFLPRVGLTFNAKADLDRAIIDTWNYDVSKDVIRELFTGSAKYQKCKQSGEQISTLIADWDRANLGKFEWPFSPNLFDQYVRQLNDKNLSGEEKDREIAFNAIKFRRIKELNKRRNDYIEYLMFRACDDLIPTFTNKSGVDFYIGGYPFDQKVSRGVSKNFIDEYGDNYRQIAINNPQAVAVSLYENQDSERFDHEPRLYVVYLDEALGVADLENSLSHINFTKPYDIHFRYNDADGKPVLYKTKCYIILLYKKSAK